MKHIVTPLVAAALLAGFGMGQASAQTYPWCAYLGPGGQDGTNCGFTTYQQCLDTIAGIGGYCQENPRYAAPARQPRRAPPAQTKSN
jgi:hypothetical protein